MEQSLIEIMENLEKLTGSKVLLEADTDKIKQYWSSHPDILKKMHRDDFSSEEEKDAWIDSQLQKILRRVGRA